MFKSTAIALALASCAFAQSDPNAQRGLAPLSTDGLFYDWQAAHQVGIDPAGDATGAFDLTTVSVQSRGTRMWIRFDISSVVNLQSGDGADGTLRILITLPDTSVLTIDFRNRSAFRSGPGAGAVDWEAIQFETGPTFAAEEYEVHIDLAGVGVTTGQTVSINFSGSDTLSAPIAFELSTPPGELVRHSHARTPGTSFRLANINTLVNGLTNNQRAPKHASLIDGVDADIYCFQEEWNNSEATIAGVLNGIDPHNDGQSWNVIKNNDNIIASRSDLIVLPALNDDYAAAIVRLPAGDIAVFSIHPKCCGYIGSFEDQLRIDATNEMAQTMADLRSGSLGEAFEGFADAPIILAGDWNLVGSREPLTILEDPDGPALTRILPMHLIGDQVTTWRGGAGSSFWPGQLDLIVYSANRLISRNHFVLETELLSAAESLKLGISRTDSQASDHLMLVADFAFIPECVGDANGDGVVDIHDLNLIVGNFAGSGPDGDVNLDGTVDILDLNTMLGNFGASCS